MNINDNGIDVQFEDAKLKGILIDTWFLETTKIASGEMFCIPRHLLANRHLLDLIEKIDSVGSGFQHFRVSDISFSIRTAPNTYVHRSLRKTGAFDDFRLNNLLTIKELQKIRGMFVSVSHSVTCLNKGRKKISCLFEDSLLFQFDFTEEKSRNMVVCHCYLHSDTFSITHQNNDYFIMMLFLCNKGLIKIGQENIPPTEEQFHNNLHDFLVDTIRSQNVFTVSENDFERYENCQIILDENELVPFGGNIELHTTNLVAYQNMLKNIHTFDLRL